MTLSTLPKGVYSLPAIRQLSDPARQVVELATLFETLLEAMDDDNGRPMLLAERIRKFDRFFTDARAVQFAANVRARLGAAGGDEPAPTSDDLRQAAAALHGAIQDIIEDLPPAIAAAAQADGKPASANGRIISIANQKGGVGKTTTAINLAASLAAAGKRTLVVDLDPQGNATSGLGIDKNALEASVYDVLVDNVPLKDVAVPTAMANLFVAPSNRELVGAEVELVDASEREYRLRSATAGIRDEYDYVFIDSPPSLSLLTINGFCASDAVIVTLQCEYYALEGLSELLTTVKLVKDNLSESLRLEGVLLTMYQHTRLSQQVIDDVRSHLGNKVFQTVIPRNVTLSEAPSYGKPVIYYDLKSAGAQAYISLGREIIARG